ncbi:MAG: hypothetical protein ACOYL5_04190 [Phototrophicaceae bacterium]
MAIALTRRAKNQLFVEVPVMPGAGTLGYGQAYRDMINLKKLGAFVTNPVTLAPRQPANGVRIVPIDAGVLVHSGLPNAGLSATIARWRETWSALKIPVILHLVATTPDEVRRCVESIENVQEIAAVELGLNDDLQRQEVTDLVRAATQFETPILVRLPLHDATHYAHVAVDAGAGGLVIAAPPRGTVRDPQTGQLVGGRLYTPTLKPLVLRLLGVLARQIQDVPLIGAGGIHNAQDARDFIEAGAVAVQVDSVTWVLPRMIEIIARDLSGLVLTKQSGALADEWFTGMGMTEQVQIKQRRQGKDV